MSAEPPPPGSDALSLADVDRGDRRGRRLLRTTASFVPAALLLVLLVAAWQLYVELFEIRDVILPPPGDVASSLVENWSIYQPELQVTAWEALQGFGLATVVGVGSAILISSSRMLRLALYPLIVGAQAIPVIAIAPLMITWFGFGLTSKVLISALIAFFPITVASAAGFAALSADAIALMRSFPASSTQIFLRARLPNALPSVFAGLKVGAVLSVVGAVVGEWVGSDRGLGHLIIRSNAILATETVFGAVVLLALLGIAFFVAVSFAEWLMLPWHRRV